MRFHLHGAAMFSLGVMLLFSKWHLLFIWLCTLDNNRG